MPVPKIDASKLSPMWTRYTCLVPLAFYLGMFLYTGFFIRPTLIYHAFARFIPYPEFRTTWLFFTECLSRPGGFLEYTHGFLSQWFYYSWAGAMILAVLAWGICACLGSLLDSSKGLRFKILPFIPALAMIADYSRYHHSLVYFLAMFYAMLMAMIYSNVRAFHCKIRLLVFAMLVCGLYYLSGSVCYVFMILAVAQELTYGRHRMSLILYPLFTAVGTWLIGVVTFGFEDVPAFLLLLPFSREHTENLVWLPSAPLIIAVYLTGPLGMLLHWIKHKPVAESRQAKRHRDTKDTRINNMFRSSGFRFAAKMIVLTVAVCLTIGLSYDAINQHVHHINYLARKKMWPELLACKPPERMPYDTYCEHDRLRALCETGRMGKELFARTPSKTSLLLTSNIGATLDPALYAKRSDLMLELGHVGIAEKNAYEQLQKMGPCPSVLDRLAMIHLVKRNYAIARVFLNLLSQDLIYRNQAGQILRQLQMDPDLTNHAEIQQLRRNMSDRDNINYHFEEGFFLQLLEKNPTNRMAFETMMAYHLLNGRIPQIAQNIHYLKNFGYAGLPRHYEEALAIYVNMSGKKVDLGPWKPGRDTLAKIKEFSVRFQKAGGIRNKAAAKQALQSRFGDSFIFYYTFAAPGGVQ